MADIEKVIKGLENCITGFDCPPECPYLDDCNDLTKPMFVELAKDALAMLKEQEAVEPILTPWIVNDDGEVNVYKMECGKCGIQFYYEDQKYCAECGTPILWDGEIDA